MNTKKYYNRFISYKYQFKDWFFENITPHLPKIPIQRPIYSELHGYPLCPICSKNPKIYAYHTGDGWMLFWDCEEQHLSELNKCEKYMIIGWFPFLFGWASGKDLERIGIKVV